MFDADHLIVVLRAALDDLEDGDLDGCRRILLTYLRTVTAPVAEDPVAVNVIAASVEPTLA